MHYFANPTRFSRLVQLLGPWFLAMALSLLCVGLVWGLLFAPKDYQQGDTIRIMYIHVPAAWMGLALYGSLAVTSVAALIWRHPVAELWGRAVAPVGAVYTLIALITGSLWGKPMWGTWWVWDARLTSVLLLFFLYLGYIAVWQAFEDESKAGSAASILAVVGVINLPIIKFSVDWWNTLHQPASVLRLDGPTIHSSQLIPLLVTAAGAAALGLWITLCRTCMEIDARKLSVRQAAQAHNSARASSHVGTTQLMDPTTGNMR